MPKPEEQPVGNQTGGSLASEVPVRLFVGIRRWGQMKLFTLPAESFI